MMLVPRYYESNDHKNSEVDYKFSDFLLNSKLFSRFLKFKCGFKNGKEMHEDNVKPA